MMKLFETSSNNYDGAQKRFSEMFARVLSFVFTLVIVQTSES